MISSSSVPNERDKKLKVLLATPVPPPDRGGIANWTRIVRQDLQRQPGIELCFVDTMVRYRGIPRFPRLSRLVFGSWQALRDSWRVFRQLRRARPALFHLNTSAGPASLRDILMLRLAKWCGVRSVVEYHTGVPLHSLQEHRAQWWLIRRTVRLADGVAVLDQRSEACVKAVSPGKPVAKLPNMVEVDAIDRIGQCSPQPLREPSGRKKVLFVGFLYQRKGVRELVEACVRLSHLQPVLDIVGDEIEPGIKAGLEAIAARAGDASWLQFRGALSHDDVLRYLLSADLFVLPTYGESAPMVILEAMGCGTPIISTTVGAIPEMLDHEGSEQCGVCIEPGNVLALAAAIEELLTNDQRRQELGRKARQRAEQWYSAPAACARLLDFWRTVARGGPDTLEPLRDLKRIP